MYWVHFWQETSFSQGPYRHIPCTDPDYLANMKDLLQDQNSYVELWVCRPESYKMMSIS